MRAADGLVHVGGASRHLLIDLRLGLLGDDLVVRLVRAGLRVDARRAVRRPPQLARNGLAFLVHDHAGTVGAARGPQHLPELVADLEGDEGAAECDA